MTDPIVRLEQTRLTAQPGGQTRTTVTVANPGAIVEGFRLEVLGEAAGWAEVTPPELAVYPQQEVSAVVVFSPPAGTEAPSGTIAFGVRARSVVDPARSAVEEGDLQIGAVFGLQSKLTPVTSTGRWSGAHAVEITNWGNVPERLRITASDPDQRLGFLVHPEVLELPVGTTEVASVQVRTRKPFLRGTHVRLPFQVVAEPAERTDPSSPAGRGATAPAGVDPRRVALDGALDQRPILSRGTVTAGAAVVALVGLLGWQAVRNEPVARADQLEQVPEVAAPQNVRAAPGDEGSVVITWEPPDPAPDSYTVYEVDPATVRQTPPLRLEVHPDIPGEDSEFPAEGLDPGRHCFQVVALREEGKSPQSEAVCAEAGAAPEADPDAGGSPQAPGSEAPADPGTTGPESPTPTPDPSETSPPGTQQEDPSVEGPEPEEWIAVVLVVPVEAAVPEAVEERLSQLDEQGFDADRLLSSQYPGLGFSGAESHVVYVRGNFTSAADVESFCLENPELVDENNARCEPRQAGPRAGD